MADQEPRYELEDNPKFIEFRVKLKRDFDITLFPMGSYGDFHKFLTRNADENESEIIIDYRQELDHFFVFNSVKKTPSRRLIELCTAYEKPSYTSRDGVRYPIEEKS